MTAPADGHAHGRGGTPQGIIIVLAAFLPIMAIVALAPAVPSILRQFADVPRAETLVPLMVTAPGLMIALLSPLMGWAADRIGRRVVLLPATALYGVLGVAPFFLDRLDAVLASRLGLGIAEAAILTVTNTLIGDYFDEGQRRRWLAAQGVVGAAFGTMVVALGGVLTGWRWNGSFLVYAIAVPIALVAMVYIFEPSPTVPDSEARALQKSRFPWRTVLGFSLVTLFSSTLYYVFIVQGGLAFDAIGVKSPGLLGYYISIASVGVPLGAVTFGLLSRRMSAAGLISIYLALFGLGMIGIGLSSSPWMMTGFAFLQQLGAGMSVPSLILWATGSLSAEHRGRGMGAWSTAFFLGQFLSPLLVGEARGVLGGILPTFGALGGVGLAAAAAAAAFGLATGRARNAPGESRLTG